jgi:hypothetical protein
LLREGDLLPPPRNTLPAPAVITGNERPILNVVRETFAIAP